MQHKCPICVGEAFAPVGVVPFMLDEVLREHAVMSCQTCGHVMVDLARVDDELIVQLYAQPLDEIVWSQDGALPYEDMVEFAGPALAELMGRAAMPKIVDFGYGRGQVLRAMVERFDVPAAALVGYDFVPIPLDGIATHALRLDTLDEHGEPTAPFDLAFCSHVFEHIVDPRRLLRGLRKNARSGAHLYLETPDHSLLNAEILAHSNQICPQHLQYFTVDRLAAMAASCGWTVVRQEVSQFGFVPRARLLLARDGASDATGATRQFLEHRAALNDGLVQQLLAASEHATIAAWGAGTDLIMAVAGSAALSQRIAAGRIVPFDRERTGHLLADAVIQDSAGLAAFDGAIVLTPRPAITRFSMKKVAERLKLQGRLVDPYHTE